jgi:hypothetical protein
MQRAAYVGRLTTVHSIEAGALAPADVAARSTRATATPHIQAGLECLGIYKVQLLTFHDIRQKLKRHTVNINMHPYPLPHRCTLANMGTDALVHTDSRPRQCESSQTQALSQKDTGPHTYTP